MRTEYLAVVLKADTYYSIPVVHSDGATDTIEERLYFHVLSVRAANQNPKLMLTYDTQRPAQLSINVEYMHTCGVHDPTGDRARVFAETVAKWMNALDLAPFG